MDFQNITNTRTDLKQYFIERNKSIPTIYIKNLVKVFQSKVQLSSVIIQVKTCQLVVIQIHGGEGEFVVGGAALISKDMRDSASTFAGGVLKIN